MSILSHERARRHSASRRRPRVAALLAGALVGLLAAAPVAVSPAHADTASDYAAAKAELERLGHESDLLVDSYGEKTEELSNTRAKLSRLRVEVESLRRATDAARADLAREVRQLYMRGGSAAGEGLAALANVSDVGAADRAVKYLTTIQGTTSNALDRYRAESEDLDTRQRELQDAEADLSEAVRALDAQRIEIEARVTAQQEITDRFRGQLEEERRREAAAAQARAEAAAREAASQAGPVAAARSRPDTGGGQTSRSTAGQPAPSPSSGAAAAIEFARAQLGKPYRWGATGPDAYDCSGLTMRSWAAGGKSIPRTSSEQVAALRTVPMSERQPGDLLWRPGHIALYVGGDSVIAAPQTGDVVSYRSASRYVKAVRP